MHPNEREGENRGERREDPEAHTFDSSEAQAETSKGPPLSRELKTSLL